MTEQPAVQSRLLFQNSFFVDTQEVESFPFAGFGGELIFISVNGTHYPFPVLIFVTNEGMNYQYPTQEMIIDIIKIIDSNSIPDYCIWHCESLHNHLWLLEQGEFFLTDVFPVHYEICKQIEFPFDFYYYNKLLIYYCHSIFWKGHHSPEKNLQYVNKYRNALNMKMHNEQPKLREKLVQVQCNYLSKITDYLRANSVFCDYIEKLSRASKNDKKIIDLINLREEQRANFYRMVIKLKQDEKEPLFPMAICQCCGRWIREVSRFPKHCGSPECKLIYERDKKRRQREHVNLEEKKRGQGLICLGCRAKGLNERKRVLFDRDLCKKCARERSKSCEQI